MTLENFCYLPSTSRFRHWLSSIVSAQNHFGGIENFLSTTVAVSSLTSLVLFSSSVPPLFTKTQLADRRDLPNIK